MSGPPKSDEVQDRVERFSPPPKRTGGRFGTLCWVLGLLSLVGIWGGHLIASRFAVPPIELILVLNLLPYVAVTTICAGFLLWVFTPDHPLAAPVVGLSVLAPLVAWAPIWPSRPDPTPEASIPLEVVSWNVQRLWGGERGDDPFACVVETLEPMEADVVLLQEVTSADVSKLTQTLPMDCFHTPYRKGDAVGAAGLAVCTTGTRWTLGRRAARAYQGASDWRYLDALIHHGDKTIRLLDVHLKPFRLPKSRNNIRSWVESSAQTAQTQRIQSREILDETQADPFPTVVAGDFNSTRDTPLHRKFRGQLRDTWEVAGSGLSWTASLLNLIKLRVDYIYAPSNLHTTGAQVVDVRCSNHRPITASLRYPLPNDYAEALSVD